jgi:hypothetical protein
MNVKDIIAGCSAAERNELLSELVKQRIAALNGKVRQSHVPITTDSGEVLGIFVPTPTDDEDEDSEEFVAELERRAAYDGPTFTFEEVIAKLEAANRAMENQLGTQ